MPGASMGNDALSIKLANDKCGIREVWASNLEKEFKAMRQVVQKYPFVAMDTEFPGVVARPIGEFRSSADYQYQLLRCNVGLLKLIQVGVTFMNEKGELPPDYSTWQFNFKFNLTEDMYAQDSIDLLQNSGLQFKNHEEDGIEVNEFAELLMVSGLVLCDNVKWLSFHSGYDFGYLLKVLTNSPLPADETDFFELLQIYFPTIYDVKYLMKSCKTLKGGLQEVADQLQVERVGPQHQAGSDSLLTGMTFFRMKDLFFEDKIDDSKYLGHLYGLGAGYQNGNTSACPDDMPLITPSAGPVVGNNFPTGVVPIGPAAPACTTVSAPKEKSGGNTSTIPAVVSGEKEKATGNLEFELLESDSSSVDSERNESKSTSSRSSSSSETAMRANTGTPEETATAES